MGGNLKVSIEAAQVPEAVGLLNHFFEKMREEALATLIALNPEKRKITPGFIRLCEGDPTWFLPKN